MTERLFTVVCEFAGGSYASQVRAVDKRQALVTWADLLRNCRAMGNDADLIADEVLNCPNALTPLTGLESVWCWTAKVRDELVLANVILSG